MHVNGHEVTTKDISGVHRGIISRKLSDWFSSVCLSWPYAVFTKKYLHNVNLTTPVHQTGSLLIASNPGSPFRILSRSFGGKSEDTLLNTFYLPWSFMLNSQSLVYVPIYVHSLQHSLGTRPSKSQKGGSGTSARVEVYTAPGMKAHF